MADQPITGLPTKTASGVASTDKMLGIDSAEGYQILVRDVAKYIIENCDVSTLAGAVRTPKAAIDLLNSKTLTRVSERSEYSISDAKLTMLNTDSDVGEDGFEVTAVRNDNTSFKLRYGRARMEYLIGNTIIWSIGRMRFYGNFNSGNPITIPCGSNGAFILSGYIQGYDTNGIISISVTESAVSITSQGIVSASLSNGILTISTSNGAASRVVLIGDSTSY